MIKKISLRNFKCFENLPEVRLSQITLFTGSNGRGKSSLIQSLLLIAQSFGGDRQINTVKLKGKFLDLGTFDDILFKGAKQNSIDISFETDDKEENSIKFQLSPYKDRERWAYIAQLNVCDEKGCKYLVELSASDSDTDSNDAKPVVGQTSTVAGIQQLARGVYYIAADRQPPANSAIKNDNLDNNQVGIHGEYLINILYRKGSEFIDQVAKEISTILKGASVRVVDNGYDYLKFLLDSADNTEGFRPVNVGFGYSYLLPIVLTCMLAENDSKVMIENPEAHLHPGAQSRLMDFMVKYAVEKKLQLLIETHSDHIINELRIAIKDKKLNSYKDACILHFTRNSKKTATPDFYEISIDSRGNLSNYPPDFLDEWGLQMGKLI